MTRDERLVVVTYPGFDLDDPQTAGRLREAGLSIYVRPRRGERSSTEVAELVVNATACIASTDPFDSAVFDACRRLRVIARVGVGVDAVDVEAATRAGVAVTITPGVNTATVADHTMALMLAAIRRLVVNDASVRKGAWNRGGSLMGFDLCGATVGIVGVGAIGSAVATRLQGFDVRIIAHDRPEVSTPPGVFRVGLDELLRSADVVTLHVPLVPSTVHLIGSRELALMRPSAFLINTARGGLVDQAALVRALQRKQLAGASLDVFEREPPVAAELLKMDDVTLTPHVAGISQASQQKALEWATHCVIEVLAGRRPKGLINPEVVG